MKMHERKQDEGKENFPLSWIKRSLTGKIKFFFYSGWEVWKVVRGDFRDLDESAFDEELIVGVDDEFYIAWYS